MKKEIQGLKNTKSGAILRADQSLHPMLFAVLPLLTVAVFIGLGYLFRRTLRKSPRFTQVVCPTCGTPPSRVHRTWLVRILSAVVPLRMYSCRSCKRTFVRVKPLREQVGAAR